MLQTIFKRLYSYLQREIFPSEDSVYSSVMIRDVGENPLSPALRDIERERGATTAQDRRWLRHLCVVCWCRGEALKVKKPPLRLSSRNECYPSPIFKPSLRRRKIYPPLPLPSSRDWKEKHYLYQGARTRNSHSK